MRYFIVFFETENDDDGGCTKGNLAFGSETYPPFRLACANIAEVYGLDKKKVVITGVNEITEKDYEDWIYNTDADDSDEPFVDFD